MRTCNIYDLFEQRIAVYFLHKFLYKYVCLLSDINLSKHQVFFSQSLKTKAISGLKPSVYFVFKLRFEKELAQIKHAVLKLK